MRLLISTALLALMTMSSWSPIQAAEELKADMKECKILFVGGKPDGTKHEGGFKKFKIDAKADFEQPSNSTIRIEIDMESLFADDPRLEGHLKNPDFFDVRKYPKAVFETTKFEMDESTVKMVGKLKMLDKTETIEIPAKVEHSDSKVTLTAKFKIDRTKWGMNYGIEGNKINKDVELEVTMKFDH